MAGTASRVRFHLLSIADDTPPCSVFVFVFTFIIFVCSYRYEALESDEEKGSDNESDVSKLLLKDSCIVSSVMI